MTLKKTRKKQEVPADFANIPGGISCDWRKKTATGARSRPGRGLVLPPGAHSCTMAVFLSERQYFLMCKKTRKAQSQPDALRVILACGLRLFWGERNPRPDRHKAGAPLQRLPSAGTPRVIQNISCSDAGRMESTQKAALLLAPAPQRRGEAQLYPNAGLPQKRPNAVFTFY